MKQARAALLRKRAEAMTKMSAASARVEACETVWEATEEPEREAIAKATEGWQFLQRRHHEYRKLVDDRAAFEERDEALRAIGRAEKMAAEEDARVEVTKKAREDAWAGLEAARRDRKRVRDELEEIEQQMAGPINAELTVEDLFMIRMWDWPGGSSRPSSGRGRR